MNRIVSQELNFKISDNYDEMNASWVKELAIKRGMNFQYLENLTNTHRSMLSRFSDTKTSRPYDHILYSDEDFIVTPTLGSVVSNWLVVWPKRPFINCMDWKGSWGGIQDLVQIACGKLNRIGCEKVIWFEHGSSRIGGPTGCGIDLAHLHLLIEPSFELSQFEEMSNRLSEDVFLSVRQEKNSHSTVRGSSYHVFGGLDSCKILEQSEKLGSQFFRRVVAELANRSTEWNYRDDLAPNSYPVLSSL